MKLGSSSLVRQSMTVPVVRMRNWLDYGAAPEKLNFMCDCVGLVAVVVFLEAEDAGDKNAVSLLQRDW